MEMSDEPNAKPISGLSSVASCAVGLRLPIAGQEPAETGHAQQPQPHHQHAGDGTAAKRHVQRRANALRGSLGCAHVGAHRHVHADEAAGTGEHRAHHEADGGGSVKENANQHRQHHAHDGNGLVLARRGRPRAPAWMAAAISCMRALPGSLPRIQPRAQMP